MPGNKPEERVLIIAPVGQDAPAMAALLNGQGFATQICEGPAEACQHWIGGAAALLLTEEALALRRMSDLLEKLQGQPSWSELPVIILTRGGESRFVRLLELMTTAAGGVTLLERPLSTVTLLRSLEVALRSRRRQYQVRDLLENKARLASIVESSQDAILSKNLEDIITSWNRGAEELFGYSAQEAVGKPFTILFPPNDLAGEPGILERIQRGESVAHYETVHHRKDGTWLDISLTVSPIIAAPGKPVGASIIARDITARVRAEKALVQAQAELKEHAENLEQLVAERTHDLRATNEQLEVFVYSIAHDLRAPLRSMIGYSQLLVEDYAAHLAETPRNLLQRIQASAEFMDKLLLDLLAFGRAARSEVSLAPVPVGKAWEAAVFQCATQIEQVGARVQAAEPLPVVLAHEATLGQCLANLLGNALKFVAPGVRPCVRCWAEPRGDYVRVWVEDNGIGIAASQHERVFRVFERLHGSRYVGTGIGLSIVRKGVERMGGKVGVQSEPGQGSRFWVELKRAQEPR